MEFELEGRGSNRSAIGARVELHWNGRTQVQEVSGGSGFSAQNDGGCTTAWATAPRSNARSFAGRQASVRRSTTPQAR